MLIETDKVDLKKDMCRIDLGNSETGCKRE
jgi:hypothetical protein